MSNALATERRAAVCTVGASGVGGSGGALAPRLRGQLSCAPRVQEMGQLPANGSLAHWLPRRLKGDLGRTEQARDLMLISLG